jgi:hypothetical protein
MSELQSKCCGPGVSMNDPELSPSSASLGATDNGGGSRRTVRSRSRRRFWIISSLIIVPLAGTNLTIWLKNRPPPKRANPWPVAYRLLVEARAVDLIALDPNSTPSNNSERFHDYRWRALGRATIRDTSEIKALAEAFRGGCREGGDWFACFEPRHAIHFNNAGHEVELVVCFECTQVWLFLDSSAQQEHTISKSARETFDRVFKTAGLEIAQ